MKDRLAKRDHHTVLLGNPGVNCRSQPDRQLLADDGSCCGFVRTREKHGADAWPQFAQPFHNFVPGGHLLERGSIDVEAQDPFELVAYVVRHGAVRVG